MGIVEPTLCEPPRASDPPLAPTSPSPAQIHSLEPPQPPAQPTPTPHDDSDQNMERWFLPRGPRTRITQGNDVRYYVRAPDYWKDLAVDLDRLQDATKDLVYLAGWEFGTVTAKTSPAIPAKRGNTLDEILSDVAGWSNKIAVRLLAPSLPDPANPLTNKAQNVAAVRLVGSLANGGSAFDPYRAITGTHHQKMVLIAADGDLIAYLGGVDIEAGRTNWTDCHCRVAGAAAFEVYLSFFERWMNVAGNSANTVEGQRDPGPIIRVPKPPFGPPSPTTVAAQVWRTYAKPTPRPMGFGARDNPGYTFAPDGEHTIYDGISNAIQKTKRFIYLQDQYLVAATPTRLGPDIASQLANKLREQYFRTLLIFVARTEALNGEIYQAWQRRADFISRLQSTAAEKVVVCQYRIAPGTVVDYNLPSYVHAKTWVFDDRFALVGSANCNRRGYASDGEIGVAIYDSVPNGDRLAAAHELRIQQWLRALNEPAPGIARSGPPLTRADVVDFEKGLQFWTAPQSDSSIERYNPNPSFSQAKNPNPDQDLRIAGFATSKDGAWNTFLDPDTL